MNATKAVTKNWVLGANIVISIYDEVSTFKKYYNGEITLTSLFKRLGFHIAKKVGITLPFTLLGCWYGPIGALVGACAGCIIS